MVGESVVDSLLDALPSTVQEAFETFAARRKVDVEGAWCYWLEADLWQEFALALPGNVGPYTVDEWHSVIATYGYRLELLVEDPRVTWGPLAGCLVIGVRTDVERLLFALTRSALTVLGSTA